MIALIVANRRGKYNPRANSPPRKGRKNIEKFLRKHLEVFGKTFRSFRENI